MTRINKFRLFFGVCGFIIMTFVACGCFWQVKNNGNDRDYYYNIQEMRVLDLS